MKFEKTLEDAHAYLYILHIDCPKRQNCKGTVADAYPLRFYLHVVLGLLLTQNRANTLECARTRERSSKRSTPAKPWADRSDRYRRPVQAGTRWKPRTASSGGTPSELVIVELL